GWLTARSWPYWLAGLCLLAAYLVWTRRHEHPAVSLRLLSIRGPAVAVMVSVLAAVVMFAALFLVPAYLEQVQGRSAAQAGLFLPPQGLGRAAGTIVGALLPRRRLVRITAIAGASTLALTTAALSLIQPATPAWLTALLLSGRGLGLGLIIQPLLVITLSELPAAEVADANTLFNIVDRVGGSFGVGLIATVFQASVHRRGRPPSRTASRARAPRGRLRRA